MPERDPADRFDDLVQLLLGRSSAGGGDAELGELLQLAADLRGFPSDEFRERLGGELLRAAATMPKGADMSTTTTPRPLRPGYHTITPYLHVERITDLLEFVKRAFAAVETLRHVGSAGGLHAEVRIGDSMVMMGGYEGITAMPAALHVYVDDADAVYARAVAAGATTLHPLVDQPYGDREASVQDPFGNHWYIATHTASP